MNGGEEPPTVVQANGLPMTADSRRVRLQAQPEDERAPGREVAEPIDEATVRRALGQRLRRLPVDGVAVGQPESSTSVAFFTSVTASTVKRAA